MSQNGANDRHNYNSKCETDEFMVAADFTLYSNPINKMLYRPAAEASRDHTRDSDPSKADVSAKTTNSASQSSSSSAAGDDAFHRKEQLTSSAAARDTAVQERQSKESSEEDEWIASDMTKYESPLADLERQGFDRDHREAQKQNLEPTP